MTKNQAESVKRRLLNVARERKEDYNFVLRQYVLQRLMYRLGASEYADDFLLKGGLLFWVWNEDFHRPTKDMDLLGFGSDDMTVLKEKFNKIIQIESDDGLVFEIEKLQASNIKEDAKYQGVRLIGRASLVKADIPYQIDIGFGDAVKSVQCKTKIPVFLDDIPAPELRVYPIESVIAEKFHAMVVLGKANSRMKDFFDIVVIANTMPLKSADLQSAIKATFDRRETTIADDLLYVFSEPFKTNSDKYLQWNAFIRKNKLHDTNDFNTIVDKIQQFIEPIYQQIACDSDNNKNWNPTTWSWI